MALRDEEPFATIRAHPRRFGWGIPVAFLAPFGLALLLVPIGLGVAIGAQLVLQTAILLWLYVPAARGRAKREDDGPDTGPGAG